jgi:hypothetical protein
MSEPAPANVTNQSFGIEINKVPLGTRDALPTLELTVRLEDLGSVLTQDRLRQNAQIHWNFRRLGVNLQR